MAPAEEPYENQLDQQPRCMQAEEQQHANETLLALLQSTASSAQHIRAELLALRMQKVVSEQARVLEHSSSKRSSVDNNNSRGSYPSPRDSAAAAEKKDVGVSPVTRSPVGQLEKSFKKLFGDRVSGSGERRASPRQPDEALSDMLSRMVFPNEDIPAAVKPGDLADGARESRTVTIHCTVPDKLPSQPELDEAAQVAPQPVELQPDCTQTILVHEPPALPAPEPEHTPAAPAEHEDCVGSLDLDPTSQRLDSRWHADTDAELPQLGFDIGCMLLSPRTTKDADAESLEAEHTHQEDQATYLDRYGGLHATPTRISHLQQASCVMASQQTSECVLMGSPMPEDQTCATSAAVATTPDAHLSRYCVSSQEEMGSSTRPEHLLLLKAGGRQPSPRHTYLKQEQAKTPTRAAAADKSSAVRANPTSPRPIPGGAAARLNQTYALLAPSPSTPTGKKPTTAAATSKVPAGRPGLKSNLGTVPVGMAPVQKARLPPAQVLLSPREAPKAVTKMDMLAKLQKVNEAFNNNRKRSSGAGSGASKSSANSTKGSAHAGRPAPAAVLKPAPANSFIKPAVPPIKTHVALAAGRLRTPPASPARRAPAAAAAVASPRRQPAPVEPPKPSNLYMQLLNQTARNRRNTAADAGDARGGKAKHGFLSARSGAGVQGVSERSRPAGDAVVHGESSQLLVEEQPAMHGFVIVSRRNTQEQLVQGVPDETLDTLDLPPAGGPSPVTLAIPTSPNMMYGAMLPMQGNADPVKDRYQSHGAGGADWEATMTAAEEALLRDLHLQESGLLRVQRPGPAHPATQTTRAALAPPNRSAPARPASTGRNISLRTTAAPTTQRPVAQPAKQHAGSRRTSGAQHADAAPAVPACKPAVPVIGRHRRTVSGPQQDSFISPECAASPPKAAWVVRELQAMPAGAPGASPWLGHELVTSQDMAHAAHHSAISPLLPKHLADAMAKPSGQLAHATADGPKPLRSSANTALVKLKLAGGALSDESAAASPGTRMRNYAYAAASLLAGKPVDRVNTGGSQSARTHSQYVPTSLRGPTHSAGASGYPSDANTPTVLSPRMPDDIHTEYSALSVHPVMLSHTANAMKPFNELISRSQSIARPSGSTSCSRLPSTRPTHEDLALSEMSVIIKKTPLGKDRSSSSLVGMFGIDPAPGRSVKRTGPSRPTPAKPKAAAVQQAAQSMGPPPNRSPGSRATTASHGGAGAPSLDGSCVTTGTGTAAAPVPRYATATAASAARTSPSPPPVSTHGKPSPSITPSKSGHGHRTPGHNSRTPSPVPYRAYSGIDADLDADMQAAVGTPVRSHRLSPGPTDSVINLTAAVEEEERSLAALLAGHMPPTSSPSPAPLSGTNAPGNLGTPTKPSAVAAAAPPAPPVWDPFTTGEAPSFNAAAGFMKQQEAEQHVPEKHQAVVQGCVRQEVSSGGVSAQGSAPSATGLCDSLASSVTIRMGLLPSNGGTDRSSDMGGPTTTSLPMPPTVLHTAPAVMSPAPASQHVMSPSATRGSLNPRIGTASSPTLMINPRNATANKATSPAQDAEPDHQHNTRAVGVNTSPTLSSPRSRAPVARSSPRDAEVQHEQVDLAVSGCGPQVDPLPVVLGWDMLPPAPCEELTSERQAADTPDTGDTGTDAESKPSFMSVAAAPQEMHSHTAPEQPVGADAVQLVEMPPGAARDPEPVCDPATPATALLPAAADVSVAAKEGCIIGMTSLGQQLLAYLPADTSTRSVMAALTQGLDALLPELPAVAVGKPGSDWSSNPACTCAGCSGCMSMAPGCMSLGKTKSMLAVFKRVAMPGTCTARVEVDHDQQVKLHLDAGCTKHWEMLINGFDCSRDSWQGGSSSVSLAGWAAGLPCNLTLQMASAASHAYLVLGLNAIMQMTRVQKQAGPGVALDSKAMELHANAHACMPMKLMTWSADMA